MSYLKTLTTLDAIITPFEVNKAFFLTGESIIPTYPYGSGEYGTGVYGSSTIVSSDPSLNAVKVDRFLARNTTSSLSYFALNTQPTTGYFTTQYQKLVFDSIKQLYYSNFTSSSMGDSPTTSSLVPGVTTGGDRLTGGVSSRGRFYNYPQTTLTKNRSFPSESNSTLGVLSIPSRIYGNYIQPSSFILRFNSGSLGVDYYDVTDDGEGNLLLEGEHCGNIIYEQGIAVLTGRYIGGDFINDTTWMEDFVNTTNVSCSFSSSLDIYDTQYKCTLRANEYNYSLNPSLLNNFGQNKTLLSGSSEYKGFVTGSNFSPFISTVGLYNENQDLIAIGKLAQPLPTSQITDTTILINIDR